MVKRRRRFTKRDSEGLASLIGLIFLFGAVSVAFKVATALFSKAKDFLATPKGQISLLILVVLFAVIFTKYIQIKLRQRREDAQQAENDQIKAEEVKRELSAIMPSLDRRDYKIESGDYRRGNSKENLYRKKFSLQLLEAFHNRCANCGENENGIDIDHFFLSKNEGGNFMLRHGSGFLVNNAIPLCRSCNRSKSDRSFSAFYSEEKALEIFNRNLQMTKKLNEVPLFDSVGEIIKVPRSKKIS